MSAGVYKDPYLDCDKDECLHRIYGHQVGLMDGATAFLLRQAAKFAGWQVGLRSPRGKGNPRVDRCPDHRIARP